MAPALRGDRTPPSSRGAASLPGERDGTAGAGWERSGGVLSPLWARRHRLEHAAAVLLWVALPCLVMGGFALRLVLLDAYPFREDEAIYSYWALHLWRVDPLALAVWPDKPPLFLWLLGGAFRLWGASEASARLLNVFASTLTIPLVAATAHRLWGRRAALIATLALTLSPFAISFAPTAYTDPTLVLWGSAALYAAVSRRPFWSGFFLAAAVMTKQQGVLYAPLVAVVLWIQGARGARGQGPIGRMRRPLLFALGFALLAGPILYWDSLRWQVAPSPWDLSVRNYGGLMLQPPSAWIARTAAWSELLWYLSGSWWIWGIAVGGVGLAAWQIGPWRRTASGHPPIVRARGPLFFGWSLSFFAVHVVTSIQVWDRYLLPLAPMLALLLGGMVRRWTGEQAGNRLHLAVVLVLASLLLPSAVEAARGGFPIGGDHGDYAGLDVATDWVRAHAPAGSILYHRLLGWNARFSFFDAGAPAQNRYELRWYPHAVYLADNATKAPHKRKFLIVPDWAPLQAAERHLRVRRIGLVEHLRAGHVTVYELVAPRPAPCAWCLCAPPTQQQPAWLVAWPALQSPASAHR